MAETPTGRQCADVLNAHVQGAAQQLAAVQQAHAVAQQAHKNFAATIDALVAHRDQAINDGRLAARAAVMAEANVATLTAERDKLLAELTALQPVVAEKAALVTENASLKNQVTELQATIDAMRAHPDVIAAEQKKADEAKAAQIASLEKAKADAEAQLAKLRG